MNLQPSEFIAKGSPHTAWSLALSYASGTASSCLSMSQRGLTSGLQPTLDTDTDTDTDTPTDKENNNDND